MLAAIAGSAAAACASASEPPGVLFERHGQPDSAAVVLAHDWFGESEHYHEFGDRLAERGYSVIGSDLYEGKSGGKTHAEAWDLLKALTDAHAASVLDSNIQRAAELSDAVIVVGFSAGSLHALKAAIRNADVVDGIIIFYGDTIKDAEELSRLKSSLLVIYGSKDSTYGATTAVEEAAQFVSAADAAGLRAETHIYAGAAHAFAQPLFNAGATYDPVWAESAVQMALRFVEQVESETKE